MNKILAHHIWEYFRKFMEDRVKRYAYFGAKKKLEIYVYQESSNKFMENVCIMKNKTCTWLSNFFFAPK